jgi:hypothetical protein
VDRDVPAAVGLAVRADVDLGPDQALVGDEDESTDVATDVKHDRSTVRGVPKPLRLLVFVLVRVLVRVPVRVIVISAMRVEVRVHLHPLGQLRAHGIEAQAAAEKPSCGVLR